MKIKYQQGMTLLVEIVGGKVLRLTDTQGNHVLTMPANDRGVKYVKNFFKTNYHIPTKESVIDFPWLV